MLPLPSSVEHLAAVNGSVEGKLEEGQLLCYFLRFVGKEVQLGGRRPSVGGCDLRVGAVQHEFKVRQLEEGREGEGNGLLPAMTKERFDSNAF